MKLYTYVTIFLVLTVGFVIGCRDECVIGEFKCDRGQIWACNYLGEESPNLWTSVMTCTDVEAVCTSDAELTPEQAPWLDSIYYSGGTIPVACVVSGFNCSAVEPIEKCADDGDSIYTCTSVSGEPTGTIIRKNEASLPYCVESEANGTADFAYEEGTCQIGEGFCFGDNMFMYCSNGFWTRESSCTEPFGLQCGTVLNESGMQIVYCTDDLSSCSDGLQRCATYYNEYYTCAYGYWSLREKCTDGMCVEIGDDTVECQ